MARGQRWQLRHTGLAEAIELLELELPVQVKATNLLRARGRYHRGRTTHDPARGEVGHLITISTYLTAEQANETLMHELVHAHQWERAHLEGAADHAKGEYDHDRRLPYAMRKCEEEARDIADAMAEEIRAVVPRGWTAGLHG